MSFVDFIFSFFSIVTILSAVCVITIKNPVIAVMQLIMVFINVSMIWMLLGAEFLSLILVLVYVGAVMVMFLFVVMMIDMHQVNKNNISNRYFVFGFIIGMVLIIESAMILCATWNHNSYVSISDANITNSFAVGYIMYSDYFICVEIGAVILLVGMISAIVLTLRTRKDRKLNDINLSLKADPNNRLVMVKFPKNINNYYANGISSKEGKE